MVVMRPDYASHALRGQRAQAAKGCQIRHSRALDNRSDNAQNTAFPGRIQNQGCSAMPTTGFGSFLHSQMLANLAAKPSFFTRDVYLGLHA